MIVSTGVQLRTTPASHPGFCLRLGPAVQSRKIPLEVSSRMFTCSIQHLLDRVQPSAMSGKLLALCLPWSVPSWSACSQLMARIRVDIFLALFWVCLILLVTETDAFVPRHHLALSWFAYTKPIVTHLLKFTHNSGNVIIVTQTLVLSRHPLHRRSTAPTPTLSPIHDSRLWEDWHVYKSFSHLLSGHGILSSNTQTGHPQIQEWLGLRRLACMWWIRWLIRSMKVMVVRRVGSWNEIFIHGCIKASPLSSIFDSTHVLSDVLELFNGLCVRGTDDASRLPVVSGVLVCTGVRMQMSGWVLIVRGKVMRAAMFLWWARVPLAFMHANTSHSTLSVNMQCRMLGRTTTSPSYAHTWCLHFSSSQMPQVRPILR